MRHNEFTPTPEQVALRDAVAALDINYKTAEETIERATSLLKGARLLLKDARGGYDAENNDSVEHILATVEDELFCVRLVMTGDEDPKEYSVTLSTPFKQ